MNDPADDDSLFDMIESIARDGLTRLDDNPDGDSSSSSNVRRQSDHEVSAAVRPHSSLGQLTPVEFKQKLSATTNPDASTTNGLGLANTPAATPSMAAAVMGSAIIGGT